MHITTNANFYIQTTIVIIGIIGELYNVNRNIKGYYFWTISNALVIYSSFITDSFGTTLLFSFYLGSSFYAIYKWKKLQKTEKNSTHNENNEEITTSNPTFG
jgi:nicotinamide riboside transporter PnuC